MTSLPRTGPSDPGVIRWVSLDQWTWQALSGLSVIGTVTGADRYVMRLADGELAGVHTSLESAQSQLDGWVRWQTAPPAL
jgi:hypothetical protein